MWSPWPLLLIPILLLINCVVAFSAPMKSCPVIVVVANNLSFDDLTGSGPSARYLLDHSALALVNTGMQRKPEMDTRYLAMSAGTRAEAVGEDANFYQTDEIIGQRTAGEVYASSMGRTAPEGSVVCLGLPKLLRENKRPAFQEECIGLVGDAFHKSGLRTAAVGNSDTPGKPLRLAPMLVMDRHGVVDGGLVSSRVLSRNPDSASGFTENPSALSRTVHRLLNDHSLVVIEMGEFNRLEALKGEISTGAYERYRRQALSGLDVFLDAMMHEVHGRHGVLIVCSPCRAQSKGDWSNLAPVLMYRDSARPGLLISATARTPGLISNIDIGPTIISAAGLKVPEFTTGRAAVPTQAGTVRPVERLRAMESNAARIYALQIPLLAGVGVFVILAATLSEVVLWRGIRVRWRGWIMGAFVVAFTLPAALLLLGGMPANGVVGYVLNLLVAIGGVLGLAWLVTLCSRRTRQNRPIAILGVILTSTALLSAGDVLTGAKLLRWSILSCDQITGIRYYGIGNEYMGLLIGTALLGPLMLQRLYSPRAKDLQVAGMTALMVAWYLFVAFVIGYPRFGANVGGLLTAVAAFGVAVMAYMRVRVRVPQVIGLLVLGFAVVAGFAAVDMLSPGGGRSHLGRSIELARIYGWDWLGYLIGGKILMHIGILRLPQTYYPILGSIPFFMMYGGRMKAELASSRADDILYTMGLPTVIAGMLVAFLFNDSGIVPAALIMALYILVIQYVRFAEE